MNQQVNFRISAYQTGDRANPRFVWGIGVPTEIVNELPEGNRRVQLEADDKHLYVKFNGEGISLNLPNPNATIMWTGHIGLHHVKGLTAPDEVVRARGVNGLWDADNKRLVVEEVPDFVQRAIERSSHHVPELEEHFPATHFSEDVQAAEKASEGKISTADFLRGDMTTTDAIVEQAHIESDPDSPTYQWFLAQVKRGQEMPFNEIVELTPALADILLRRNAGNRNIRSAKLNQYVSDIVADRWELNGETIQVSREGDLNNGQHRCSAVLAANKSIRTFMVFGVSRESRVTVDVGATRSAGDHLGVQGYKNSVSLAGITRFLIAYESSDPHSLQGTNRVTAAAVNQRVRGDDLLIEAAHVSTCTAKLKRLAPPSVLGFCYYLMASIDKEDAKKFIEQVASGLHLERHEPAYVVRETLINRPGLSRECKIEVILRGWNLFRAGKPMRSMRIMYELPELV